MRLAIALVALLHPEATLAATSSLPREPSELLLVGDSVTAGIHFMSLDDASIRQSWAGQLVRRLGIEPPPAPYRGTYPLDHLRLTEHGTLGGLRYLKQATPLVLPKRPQFSAEDERVILAIPGQMLPEVLTQSSRSKGHNKHSSGWTFGKILLPRGLSAIETAEQWTKKPAWVVVFLGANDLLAYFGIVGDAGLTTPAEFRKNYLELVTRLRRCMAPEVPATHLLVLTLPDVSALPFLQPLPETADDGHGRRFPSGSKASAFLIPFRTHFQEDEVWTPEELDVVRETAAAYKEAIIDVANIEGLTVVDVGGLLHELERDPAFGGSYSPYFSPDLHHPSFRTHEAVADKVLRVMSELAGTDMPPPLAASETPLPSAGDLAGKQHERVATLTHLALLGLASGPLPPSPTWRISAELGGQLGSRRAADASLSVLAGVEMLPIPVTNRTLARACLHARGAMAALDASSGTTELLSTESMEGRLGVGVERIGAWNWMRGEAGFDLTLDGAWDGGVYARAEWQVLYVDAVGRDGWFDTLEAGFRWGAQPGRTGRNGN